MSVNIGKVESIDQKGKMVQTGIFKNRIDSPVTITRLGIAGDEQADLVNHGGVEQAVCAYPFEHYPFWEKKLGKSLDCSAFGENLTLIGLTEDEVRIGDTLQWGTAVLQVSQPRKPCFKIGLKHGEPQMALWVKETGYSGFYLRVLTEGVAQSSDPIQYIERMAHNPSVTDVNQASYSNDTALETLGRMAQVPELSRNWRRSFEKKAGKAMSRRKMNKE